jgi:hypothetical protein
MFSDYIPLTLDEWIELDRKRREKIAITDYDVTKTDASRKSLKTDLGVLMGESKCSS